MEDYSRPVLPGTAPTDYERYLRTEELLALQKTAAEMVHRDELLFQTVHQSSELWLKLACFELETATDHIANSELSRAVRLLRRATDAMELVTRHLHMLEHMSPWDYHSVRRALGHGAGFDSPGFRRVIELSPPLGDAFHGALRKQGISLVELYQRSPEFEDLFQLGELLVAWDEHVGLWRFHHLKLVERVIGGRVIGTQGTPVEILVKRLDLRFFPELWEVRNELTRLASGTAGDAAEAGHAAPPGQRE